MNATDLLRNPPTFDAVGELTIEALAPLSMVARMPGKFYRSQAHPTREMLYGMLENALGWHIGKVERDTLLKELAKLHGKPTSVSGADYRSLLQFHVRFETAILPSVTFYSDYWSQHLHTTGLSFANGSREYDKSAIPIMSALASKQITVSDKASASRDPRVLTGFVAKQEVHLEVLRPLFPQYYVSPTPREYVIPNGDYHFRVVTSGAVASELCLAVCDPAAPLYLGSNDGWVEAGWRDLN